LIFSDEERIIEKMSWFKNKKKEENASPEEAHPINSDPSDNDEETPAEDMQPDVPDEDMPESSADTEKGVFKRLRKGLSKTREILTTDIDELFVGNRKLDDDLLEEIEERLITSDIGVQITMDIMEKISKQSAKITNADQLKAALKAEIVSLLKTQPPLPEDTAKPHVIMVAGVNGVGKTTTIGKLAAKFGAEGKKVLIAAADTFRAAAIEQVVIWADRAGADIVRHQDNADPAAVAYDSIEAAIARGRDIVIVDTAGRLHTKVNLMEELKKIRRAISKNISDAPHETLLVLDATTGQNALSQAKMFNDALGVTGIALTKLDGTARGGIVISICSTLDIPLKYIGVGEQIDDLQEFDPVQFADAIF